jgi:hypothetical protein
MCGLCGLFGTTHWSEASAHPDAFPDGFAETQRVERMRRAALVGAIAAPFRISLHDFQGSSYLVRGPTGASVMVDDIQAVWAAIEKLAGKVLDPLDPEYLRHLEDRY